MTLPRWTRAAQRWMRSSPPVQNRSLSGCVERARWPMISMPTANACLARLETWMSIWRDALVVAAGAPEDIADPEDADRVREMDVSLREAQSALNETMFTIKALRQNANARLALESYVLALP